MVESELKNKVVMIQPHLINPLTERFEKELQEKQSYKTPGTPRFKIQHPSKSMDVLDPVSQKIYRFGVGMSLYLKIFST